MVSIQPMHYLDSILRLLLQLTSFPKIAFIALAIACVSGAPGYLVGYGPHYPVARPLVAHPNGAVVPLDEPAVIAARANHLAAKAHIVGSKYGLYGYYG